MSIDVYGAQGLNRKGVKVNLEGWTVAEKHQVERAISRWRVYRRPIPCDLEELTRTVRLTESGVGHSSSWNELFILTNRLG